MITLREQLREHQEATGTDDSAIVEVLCEFIQGAYDEGLLPEEYDFFNFVVDALERGPGDCS